MELNIKLENINIFQDATTGFKGIKSQGIDSSLDDRELFEKVNSFWSIIVNSENLKEVVNNLAKKGAKVSINFYPSVLEINVSFTLNDKNYTYTSSYRYEAEINERFEFDAVI